MSKLEEQELTELREQESKKNAIIQKLGLLEAEKHSYLHALAEVQNDQQGTFKELEDKYGKIEVNLEDGSFTEVES